MRVVWFAACCVLLCHSLASPALAQTTAPNSDDAFLLQREREEQRRRQQDSMPDVRLSPAIPETSPRLPDDESPCVAINRIEWRVDGVTAPDWLSAAASRTTDGADDPVIGRCVGARGVGMIIQRLQQALLRRGWVTSRVLVEPQDLSSGVLRLALVTGRVRSLRFADGTSFRATLSNAMPLQPGDVLDLRALEQGLENLKRLPTVDADVQIVPASAADAGPGDSDIVVRWSQARPVRVSVTLDDTGTRNTGRLQSALSIAFDNPLSLNDIMYVTVSAAVGGGRPGPRGSDSRSISYAIPWRDWLLSLSASDWNYRQSIAGRNGTIIYSGSSQASDFSLARLLHRDSVRKTVGSLRLWQRASHNFIDDAELTQQRRRTAGWELALTHREQIRAATLDANLAYRRGTGAFDAMAAPEQAYGEGTARMRIVRADLQLSLPFSLGTQAWRYSAGARAQWNGTPLTPQDRFALGNRYTVRGFDGESLLTGDRGWLLRQEIGRPVGTLHSEAYLGIDAGRVGGRSIESLADRDMRGAVLGLRGGARGFAWDVFVGHPLSRPQNFSAAGTTAGFYLSASY